MCGSDGNTYANECELRLESCQRKQYISIAFKGICDMCKDIVCKHGSYCFNGECVCPKECPSIYEPICSSAGITYANECKLRLEACQKRIDVSISFYGECQEVDASQMSK